jgi:uncharacterized RDD family membrane protein YckC
MAQAEETVHPLPGIRRRLASMSYEALLLLGVLVAMIVPLVLLGAIAHVQLTVPALRVYVMLGFALYFLRHWSGGRQTLAMRTWKLSITTPAGDAPPLWRLTLRYVLAWPSLILAGSGILWALVDRDRQFLHDRLAGTRITFAPPTRS